MDIIKRRKYPITVRVIYSLTLFSICYITLVRPVRVYINQNLIAPFYLSLDEAENSRVTMTARRINIQPDGYNSPRGFGIPFGGYFWLPFALFIATRQKCATIGLTSYHLNKVKTNSKFLNTVLHTFGFLKFPAPAVELTKGKLYFHPIYY